MKTPKGRNCVCGRWAPGFAETCVDCGRPQNKFLVDRLADFFSGEGGRRSQRPAARKAARRPGSTAKLAFLALCANTLFACAADDDPCVAKCDELWEPELRNECLLRCGVGAPPNHEEAVHGHSASERASRGVEPRALAHAPPANRTRGGP